MIARRCCSVASSSWPISLVREAATCEPGSAFAWMTSGRRSRNCRMPGVSAAASLSNALVTST